MCIYLMKNPTKKILSEKTCDIYKNAKEIKIDEFFKNKNLPTSLETQLILNQINHLFQYNSKTFDLSLMKKLQSFTQHNFYK